MDPGIGMKLHWFVPPHELGPITFALHVIMAAAREEPGYLNCRLSTGLGSRVSIEYVEEWRAEPDLVRQLRSSRFAHLAELIERGLEAPQVEFRTSGGVRGLDYAVEVRGGAA